MTTRPQRPDDAAAGATYSDAECDVESLLSNLAVDCMQLGALEKVRASSLPVPHRSRSNKSKRAFGS